MARTNTPESELRPVKVKDLHFDPKNPRLPEDVRINGDEKILEWMLKFGNIIELMESIAATGYSSAEPVLAVKREQGGYTVVEGNRRLAAVKLLNSPDSAPLRKNAVREVAENARRPAGQIPVLVYKERGDILDYLGYRHITGIKTWGPDAKAKYLEQLFESYMEEMKDEIKVLSHVSKMVGTKPYHARKILLTLAMVKKAQEDAFWGADLSPEDIDFSVLSTALSYESVLGFLGLEKGADWHMKGFDTEKGRDLFEWIFGQKKVVGESRKLKTLDCVLRSPEALQKLYEGRSLDDSAQYSGEAGENYREFISKAIRFLKDADAVSSRVDDLDSMDLENARELHGLAKKVALFVKNAVEDLEFD